MPTPRSCALICLLLLSACGTPPDQPEVGIKEVYVEGGPEGGQGELQPFPFAPEAEVRAYSVVLGFDAKTRVGRHYLGQLLAPEGEKPETKPEAPKTKPEAPKTKPEAPKTEPEAPKTKPEAPKTEPEAEPDLAKAPIVPLAGNPSLLLFPEKIEMRQEGVCYVGHAAYAKDRFAPRSRVIHHLRILLANRGGAALFIPLDQVALARLAFGPSLEGGPVAGSALTLLASADAEGRRLEELVVEPGGVGQAHLFFLDEKLTTSLDLRWTVKELSPRRGGQEPPSWSFKVALKRRYTLQEGVLSPLELRVRGGWELPESGPGIEVFNEPRVMPLAPAGR